MNGEERRNAILSKLQDSLSPISASALASEFSVTRQIIVADIALLRASGESISAKSRGYVLDSKKTGLIKRIAVKHGKDEVIDELYYYMKKNTDWWLNFRGETPCYYHGNDSGNDNATCFDNTEIIQSPDLIAYLSVQCEVLSQMAEKLNLCTDKRIYKMLSDELSEKCATHFWDGEIFIRNGMTEEIYRPKSLMPLRMIVLEEKLPKEIKDYILEALKKDFLCPYGLASESFNSPFYTQNGYWRGPAWGPDQIIFGLALKNIGEDELSNKIASGYRKAIEKSGYSENHDPLTGDSLKCKAYSWTANAYRLLAF